MGRAITMETNLDELKIKVGILEEGLVSITDVCEDICDDIDKIKESIEKINGLVALEKYRNDGNATSK